MQRTESAEAPIYRASTLKRVRRTKAAVEQLDEQIIAVLSEDHPQSVRHVFYRMTNPRLAEVVEKSDRGYRHVQDRCVRLRRAGRLPYGWITDSSRRGYFTETFSGASDFLHQVVALYRADLWEDSIYYCEVWTESRSIAAVIQADCAELAVSLYPAGGFSSITLAYQAAEYINESSRGREVVIFYVGDYDPAGVLIDIALERELRAHLDPNISLSFKRIGITPEQIQTFDLPTKSRNPGDLRARHVDRTVEAEAMPARIMRQLIRSEVESLLPTNALQVARAAEESERAILRAWAGGVQI
jgi:hypothetical protein